MGTGRESGGGWFKFPNHLVDNGWLAALSEPEKDVLLVYMRFASNEDGNAWVGPKRISEALGKSDVRGVRRTVAMLEEKGILQTVGFRRIEEGGTAIRRVVLPKPDEKPSEAHFARPTPRGREPRTGSTTPRGSEPRTPRGSEPTGGGGREPRTHGVGAQVPTGSATPTKKTVDEDQLKTNEHTINNTTHDDAGDGVKYFEEKEARLERESLRDFLLNVAKVQPGPRLEKIMAGPMTAAIAQRIWKEVLETPNVVTPSGLFVSRAMDDASVAAIAAQSDAERQKASEMDRLSGGFIARMREDFRRKAGPLAKIDRRYIVAFDSDERAQAIYVQYMRGNDQSSILNGALQAIIEIPEMAGFEVDFFRDVPRLDPRAISVLAAEHERNEAAKSPAAPATQDQTHAEANLPESRVQKALARWDDCERDLREVLQEIGESFEIEYDENGAMLKPSAEAMAAYELELADAARAYLKRIGADDFDLDGASENVRERLAAAEWVASR